MCSCIDASGHIKELFSEKGQLNFSFWSSLSIFMVIIYLNSTFLMYTGTLPYIDVHPEIQGTVEPGDFLWLKCKASGKGSLHYLWQHENQTLVKETRQDLIIKHVKESDQGEYKCRVTNAFGYALSNSAELILSKHSIFSPDNTIASISTCK